MTSDPVNRNVTRGWLRTMAQTIWQGGKKRPAVISTQTAERLIGSGKDQELHRLVKREGISLSEAIKRVQQAVASKPCSVAPRKAAAPSSSAELITTPRPADAGNWARAIAGVNAEFKVGSPR
ncbi:MULTISPECIES: hypothetical protein [unclassified Bradyrhizobium]|uniref:hypothetical protein n=1 Tax=Bradyrhizobium sp. USDA 4541 TaxID=2817704 RepID=UPI0020A57A3E|nr:hypothetical protein [Bradyrhizobium sp. USDA 4541]MCP1851232.1 hypothetical protein [Bradyrhizobium sp. USDA 4541]